MCNKLHLCEKQKSKNKFAMAGKLQEENDRRTQ